MFDPIGKFMASQSNQDKTLIIWRIMDNYKKFVKEKQFKEEYANNTTMSQSARLDWSNDGMIISSTSGFISGMYTSPLIS